MDTQTFVLFIIITLGIIGSVAYYFLTQMKKGQKTEDSVLMEWVKEMKGTVEKNTEVLERQLKDQRTSLEEQLKNQRLTMTEQTKFISERLEKSQDVIREVQKQLG